LAQYTHKIRVGFRVGFFIVIYSTQQGRRLDRRSIEKEQIQNKLAGINQIICVRFIQSP
jgi:hypothetical protein